MILQGVGHQISCLGVCYANDPKKGGYMTPAPALDLTNSLRGDIVEKAPRTVISRIFDFPRKTAVKCTMSDLSDLGPKTQGQII